MAEKGDLEELTELVRTLLIAQLRLAGVPQRNIRAVARCDVNRVSEVIKQLKIPEKRENANKGGR